MKAHQTLWTVARSLDGTNKSSELYKSQEEAVKAREARGGIVIAPHNTYLYTLSIRYKTPSGKWSYVNTVCRGRDMQEAQELKIASLAREPKRNIWGLIEVLDCRLVKQE